MQLSEASLVIRLAGRDPPKPPLALPDSKVEAPIFPHRPVITAEYLWKPLPLRGKDFFWFENCPQFEEPDKYRTVMRLVRRESEPKS
jgi:hypothetical protein